MTRLLSLLALALVLAGGLATVGAGSASAGTIVDWACGGRALDGWDTTLASPGVTTFNNCSSPNQNFGITSAAIPFPAHANATWFYTAASGETVTGYQFERFFVSQDPGGVSATAYSLFRGTSPVFDAQHLIETCWGPLGCTELGGWNNNQALTPASGLSFLLEACASSSSCSGAGFSTSAQIAVKNVGVTLEDDSRPVSTNLVGELANGQLLTGDAKLFFNASDTGTGLWQVHTVVDGAGVDSHVVDPNGGKCALVGVPLFAPAVNNLRHFAFQVPCLLSDSVETTVHTAALTDGQHHLRVTIEDAAGNTSTVLDKPITVQNAPTNITLPLLSGAAVQDAELTTTDGTWSGGPTALRVQWQRCSASGGACVPVQGQTQHSIVLTSADVGSRLRAAVTATNSSGSTTAQSAPSEVVQAHQSGGTLDPGGSGGGANGNSNGSGSGDGLINGVGASHDSKLIVLSVRRGTLKAKYRVRSRIRGRLVNASGKPIIGARIQVDQKVRGGGSLKRSYVNTDHKGYYTYRGFGPSRSIAFGYRYRTLDTTFDSVTQVGVRVTGKVALKVARRLRNHRPVVFGGRVLGGWLPRHGVSVVIEVAYCPPSKPIKKCKSWRLVKQGQTKRNGRFKIVWPRLVSRPYTYWFRARAIADSKWGYDAVSSAPRPASVR